MRIRQEPEERPAAKARRLSGIAAALGLLLPGVGAADRVTVKGVALEGTIESITSKEIVMKTVYGKGSLAIPVRDVEAIETDGPFHVFHGDDVDTLGRVVGISPQAVEVDVGGVPTEVPFAEVYTVHRDPGPDAELLERAAVELAYWSGHYDVNLSAALATTDTVALGTGFGFLRGRGPERLRIEGRYRLGMERIDGEAAEKTQNEALGQVRQELDLTPRVLVFGAADAEYDQIEEVTIRTVPTLGLGYVVYKSEAARVAVEAGGGYVYQRFFGGDTANYPTTAFGVESDLKLPLAGATWHVRVDYTPSVTHWAEDWLLRGESWLLVPLASSLAFKASLLNTHNSSPAEGADRRSYATSLGLSLGF